MTARDELQFTFLACADLKAIWDAIAMPTGVWGGAFAEKRSAAEDFASAFAKHCELLEGNPGMGRARDELQHGIRSSSFRKYVVFYRVRGQAVEVIRVLRASRDIGAAA